MIIAIYFQNLYFEPRYHEKLNTWFTGIADSVVFLILDSSGEDSIIALGANIWRL